MALKELRTASRTWVAGILVGLLVLSFAIWGVQDIFADRQGRGVARIGGEWISLQDFQRRLQSEITNFAQQTGQRMSAEEAQQRGIADRLLENMINFESLEVKGRQIGLASHDDTVIKELRDTPAFKGLDGSFDPNTYERVLREYNFTAEVFEDSLRGDIIREQIITGVTEGALLPRGIVEALITHRTERRNVSFVTISKADIAEPQSPSDDELKAFISERQSQFNTDEARSFVALVLRPEDFIKEVSVSDEEIAEKYEYDKSRYAVAEKRTIRTLSFPDATAAAASLDRIKGGQATFEDEAKARGMSTDDIAYSTVTLEEMFDGKVAEAVFGAAQTGLVGPIDGELAWTIADIQTIVPGSLTPLADVSGQIREEIAATRSVDIVYETVEMVEDSRAEGQTLEEIAERLNLRIVKANKLTTDGFPSDSDEEPLEFLGDELAFDVLGAAFGTEEGLENDFEQGKDGTHYVVRLDEILPPAPRAFDDVKGEATDAYLNLERRKALQSKAQDLLSAAQSSGGLSSIASAVGREATTLDAPIDRQTQHTVLPPSLIEDLFSGKIGELMISSAVNGQDWVIASVTEVLPPSTAEVSAGVTQVAPQLDQALKNDLAAQYVRGLREELDVTVDQTMVSYAISGLR